MSGGNLSYYNKYILAAARGPHSVVVLRQNEDTIDNLKHEKFHYLVYSFVGMQNKNIDAENFNQKLLIGQKYFYYRLSSFYGRTNDMDERVFFLICRIYGFHWNYCE